MKILKFEKKIPFLTFVKKLFMCEKVFYSFYNMKNPIKITIKRI